MASYLNSHAFSHHHLAKQGLVKTPYSKYFNAY